MKLIDITGQKFGRLTVLEKLPPRVGGGSLWLCVCDCGNLCERIGSSLRRGGTPSCGCFQSEWASKMGANRAFIAKRSEKTVTHGAKRGGVITAEYLRWLHMKSRCYTPSDKSYQNWGGRGIRVCDRWLNDFSAFLADMGPLPTPQHTLDRIDPNGNYEPGNCRWATREQQGGEHRRGFVSVTVGGITFDKLAAACRHFGVGVTTVSERLRAGIPVEQAFTPGRLKSRRDKESYIRKELRQ
jgi:hypothetical protein